MSSVVSNANLTDFNVYDTFVESAEAALGPSEFDNLLFALNCNPQPVVALSGTTNYALTVADYMQAMNSYLTVSCATGGDCDLTVGADTVANAQTLISLFGLSSSNPYRILNFVSVVADTNGTGASPGIIRLANTSAAHVYIDVVSWADATADTQELYANNNADNGVQRRVQVYCSSFTATAEVVKFRLLQTA